MHRRTVLLFATLATLLLSSLIPALAAPPAALAPRYFPETQHNLQSGFLDYWTGHGALAQQGYPLTEEFAETSPLNGQTYNVQYFERAVFEYHPENAGTPYTILLSQLGTFRYKQKYPTGAPNQSPHQVGGQYFAQTGHWVGGGFLAYWQQHGAVAQQGYPLSDEFQEISDQDGKPYQVQYFERAVFEYHPENAGTPYTILLSQLGKFALQSRYPNNSLAAAAPQPPPVGQGPAATPTPGATDADVTDLAAVLGLQLRFNTVLPKLTDEINAPDIRSAAWFQRVATDRAELRAIADAASAIQPTPKYRVLNETFARAMQHYARSEDLFSQGQSTDPENVDLLQQGVAELQLGEAAYAEFQAALDAARSGSGGPAATPSPAPPNGYTVTAYVSDKAPTHNERVTVIGDLLQGDQGVVGVTMHTVWSYKTVTETCDGTTNDVGIAACTRDISRATSGYPVRIDVTFLDASGSVLASTQTSFTPQ